MLAALLAVPFFPPAVLMLVAGSIISLSIRTTVARYLLVVSGAFRQVEGLLAAAGACAPLSTVDTAPIVGTITADAAQLSRLRRIASWVSRDSTSAVSGQLGSLVLEYLNLLFCLDANALFFGARELAARGPELLRVIHAVGEVDAAQSVASYRAGVTGWTRPQFAAPGSPSVMTAVRHPLLPDAVPNTIVIDARRGAIITGSNMSGKTTFLRTVGVTTVLAQTINTCLAEEYRSPAFVVRSCIGRADDPSSGKSYYLVEVESVLTLVNWSRTATPHLFLFDELFRGTNAVERIAAGEAVLHALVVPRAGAATCPHAVLAATHDQELVDLLRESYAAYHFTDTIDDQGLSFDFRLLPGAATTRNAILLLRLRGAPEDLVEHALARAAELDRARLSNRS
jgi:DNA mismatch repair ATPase MutS